MRIPAPLLLLVLLAALPARSPSGETPVLDVPEGVSTVALSVVNAADADLVRVTVAVDHAALPAWLSVQEAPIFIRVPKGSRSPERLSLVIRAHGAPRGAEALVPFTLCDGSGNRWHYSFRARAFSGPPERNILYGNTPNPFNPSTTIRFFLRNDCRTLLTVHNSLGQKVRTLASGTWSAGPHTVMWDGRDDEGRAVSGGVYFCRLRAGEYERSHKMLLAR